MKPTNLTNLDFNDIRESIKSYMRTRPEFSDYDFTGSTLSYLLDVLAYNTYYSAFNANMALNELFLDSASTRDNVVNLAKLLNYTPRSYKASKACITLNVQTEITSTGAYPSYAVLKKGTVCSGNILGKSYGFVIMEDKTTRVNQATGTATFENFAVYQGNLLTYEYIVDNTLNTKYIVPNDKVDTELLKVSVGQNTQATQYDSYNLVQNITTIDPTSRAYFLSETEDRRYEVVFGDGILGKELETGQVVKFEYIVTDGIEANNIQQFNYTGLVVDPNDQPIDDVSIIVNAKSQIGSEQESVKSIKFNAPKYYAAQNRAVTAKDYESLTKIIYPNAKYVNAYGGETLTPPVYGKVFLSVRTKTGAKLNNLTKKDIIRNLRPYAMASVDVVIEDPNELFVDLNILIVTNDFVTNFGDGTLSESVSQRIKSKALNAIQEYGDNEDLNNFDKTFSLSKLQTDVLKSDKNIQDVLTNVSLYKRADYPQETGPRSFTFEFGVSFDCSCNTSAGKSIQSSVYYTTDRPGVPQYFEDDGSGTLRSFTLINNKKTILDRNVGTYDCDTGRIEFGPVNIEGGTDLEETLSSGSTPESVQENILYAPGTQIPGIMCVDTSCQNGTLIPLNANNTSFIFVPTGLVGGTTLTALPNGSGVFTPSTSSTPLPGLFNVNSTITGVASFVPTGSTATTPTGATGGVGTPTGTTPTGGGTTVTPGGTTSTSGGTALPIASTTGAIGATTIPTPGTITGSTTSVFVPTSIVVGAAPSSLSISPGAYSPGTTMTFPTPTISVVPPGSPTILSFPSGGITGSPSTTATTPGLLTTLTFAPSSRTSLTSVGSCFI